MLSNEVVWIDSSVAVGTGVGSSVGVSAAPQAAKKANNSPIVSRKSIFFISLPSVGDSRIISITLNKSSLGSRKTKFPDPKIRL
jgi:hypothetical protein